MTSISTWLILASIFLVIAGIVFGTWYYLTNNLVSSINAFATKVTSMEQRLQSFSDDCAARDGVSAFLELAEIVSIHAATIDESRDLIEEASLLAVRVKVLTSNPAKLFFHVAVSADEIKDTRTALVAARRRALEDVHYALTDMLPDMREKLSQLPIQGGTIGLGVLTLVGIVWMSGFYGILGVPFIPLLRDFNDVALVGIGAGLLPLMVFTGMAAFTLFGVSHIRDVAKQSRADAFQIVYALKVARDVRQPIFWAQKAFTCLLAVFLVSVAAASVASTFEVNSFDVAVTEKHGTERMRILGGIGDYYVLIRSADHRVITLPKGKLECFETPLPGDADFCVQPEPPAGPQTTLELAANQSEDWRSYVQRNAQCWVVAPTTRQPLLSPAFVAGKSETLYLEYYETRGLLWPYSEQCPGSRTEACAIDNIYSELKYWLAKGASPRFGKLTLHFFGFASGTALPEANELLSHKRAEHIAAGVIAHAVELEGLCHVPPIAGPSCPIDIQIHGMGEMPRFNWAGTQGDPTEQVVLIAACNDATR